MTLKTFIFYLICPNTVIYLIQVLIVKAKLKTKMFTDVETPQLPKRWGLIFQGKCLSLEITLMAAVFSLGLARTC